MEGLPVPRFLDVNLVLGTVLVPVDVPGLVGPGSLEDFFLPFLPVVLSLDLKADLYPQSHTDCVPVHPQSTVGCCDNLGGEV